RRPRVVLPRRVARRACVRGARGARRRARAALRARRGGEGMSAQARRVLVVTAGGSGGLPGAIHDLVGRTRAEALVVTPAAPAPDRGRSQHRGRGPALALFDADFLLLDRDLAERARPRLGLPTVPPPHAA